MRTGDTVFFHVLVASGPSRVHGVYLVRDDPYFDNTKVWDDRHELFPFRFLFEPHPAYRQLCARDANVEVVDFYELIEQRKIWSLATLENEINIEARSVRKIESESETREIVRLLQRDLRQRSGATKVSFSLVPNIECMSDRMYV